MTESSHAHRRLAALMAGMGTLHMIAPKPFDALVPERLPSGRPPLRFEFP